MEPFGFKPIPGHEKYLISEIGEVFSTVSNKILKTAKNPNGYVHTNLGSGKCFDIHPLVMLTYIGPRPHGATDINHINGNKSDNRLSNLEYCSRSHNGEHSYRVLGRKPVDVRGSANPSAALNETQVREIFFERHKSGRRTQAKLASDFSVSKATITRIQSGRYWSDTTADVPKSSTFDRGETIRGVRHSRTTLSEQDVIDIFLERYKETGRRSLIALAKHFGISKGAVTHIQQGRVWTHVTNKLRDGKFEANV